MRGRIAGAGVVGLVLVATAATLGASAASAACPNEAFRTGPSAQLPECRAYEQVTPVDKESGESVMESGNGLVGTTGDEVFFSSTSAYVGAQGNILENPYVATRSGPDWDTRSIEAVQSAPGGVANLPNFGAVSRDLRLAVLTSGEALTPGATPEGSNIYLRDNLTGAYTLILARPGVSPIRPPIAAATADFGRILFNLPEGIFEFSAGQLRLLVPEATVASGGEATPNGMSADGSRFFYRGSEGVLYEYRRGQEPLQVSEDEEGTPISTATFLGATPDGDVAFFLSGFEGSVYRFVASAPAGDRITDITPPTPGGEGPGVLRPVVGEDGTHVYFAARALLTADAEPRPSGEGFDFYAWQGEPGAVGSIHYLGKSEIGPEQGPRNLAVSRNGRFFAFESAGQVTADAIDGSAESCPFDPFRGAPVGRCSNVFLYSADSDRIACVTCDGSPPSGNSRLGGADRLPAFNYVRPVLDDGMVLFDTPNPLQPRDVNGVRDAYAWQGGRTQLISSGTSGGPSNFINASADGSNIFFGTEQPLVGQDTDSLVDLYDARIDGGLPQGGAPSASPCVGESSCRGGLSTPVPPARPGTGTVGGAREGSGSCQAPRTRVAAARKGLRALERRATKATGRRSKALGKHVKVQKMRLRRLARRVADCQGGGR